VNDSPKPHLPWRCSTVRLARGVSSLATAAFVALAAPLASGCQQSTATQSDGIAVQQQQASEQGAKYWERHCCRRGARNGNR